MFQATTATHKLLKLRKRIRGIAGGTSASKTISILLWLIDYAQTNPNKLISVVSETLPHLKRGAIRDFLNIMEQQRYFRDSQWNKTDFIYDFGRGTKMEFFSVEASERVKGARRDVLFVNEANNVKYETYTQLEIRTRGIVWLDWNPVSEFWWYEEVEPNNDVDFLTLTYQDNEALEDSIINAIESRKYNRNWWQVYGLGQLGEIENRIYTGWRIIDKIPFEAKRCPNGLDFGYTNDPTAIVAVYKYNGGLIFDELCYRTGMLNSDIASVLLNEENKVMTVADSAEPKSIEEIKQRGVFIRPAKKGKDSVNQGIQLVKDYKISVTKRSTNLIKEYRNYLWKKDRDDKIINKPEDMFNHALDAIRYAVMSMNIDIDRVKKQPSRPKLIYGNKNRRLGY